MPAIDRRAARGGRLPRRDHRAQRHDQPVAAPRQRAADGRVRRPHRRRAARTARPVELGPLRARDPRRRAVRARRRRHEVLDRGVHGRRRGVRRRKSAAPRLDRPAADLRRGRPGDRRDDRGHRAIAGARRSDGLLHRRRADLGRTPGRHDQERPARLAVGQAHGARRPGARGLSAAGAQSGARAGAGARRPGVRALGPRRRALSRNHVPGVQRPCRHRRDQRHSRRLCRRLQPALRAEPRRPTR